MIYSMDAEQSVLGGLLLENDAYDRLGSLKAADFSRADHQEIFKQLSKLLDAGIPADVITLSEKISADVCDMTYLHALTVNTPSTANIGRYADIVRGYSQRRAMVEVAKEMQESASVQGDVDASKLLDHAQASLERIAEQRVKSDPVKVGDDLTRYITELQKRSEGEGPKAIPTGFADLDRKMMGGIRRGELAIVAARPKMGKSAFAFNWALNAAANYSVLILSMEMPKDQLHDRNVAVLGKIDLPRIIDPRNMEEEDWTHLTSAIGTLEQMNLFVDDQGALRLMDVRMKARAIKRRHGLDLLVIDYLQLMEGEGDNRNAQIESITRGLKALAKEMKIGIVLLSQLNRQLEQRPNKRPMPSDLRDSGAIEQDCDMALFLYRDEVYNEHSRDKGICEVNVGLIRQGEPGTVGLQYIGRQTKFNNLEYGREFGQPAPKQEKSRGLRD